MDPYEILGVRPNAGRDEIELAYKGRRSQYHPDRYAQSDAETQAWATGKMQEVNQAYRVLNEPQARAQFDQRKASSHSGSRSPPPPEAQPSAEAAAPDVAPILLKPEWEWFHDNVYARPKIPLKKLEGAISSYALSVAPRDVLVLLDDTVFGGAKEGLLVTGDAIYCKQKFETPRRMLFRDIRLVDSGPDSRVMINGSEFFKAVVIDQVAIQLFASRLATALKSASSQPVDSTTGTTNSCHAGSGAERLLGIHRRALLALQCGLGEEALLIDELIDRQMPYVVEHFSEIKGFAKSFPKQGHGSIDAQVVEVSLTLFLMLHYYGLSGLPESFKEAFGGNFTQFHEVSEVYKDEFLRAFSQVFGRECEMGEEDVRMMSFVFFHRDGAVGGFDLKVPRKDALLMVLSKMGLSQTSSQGLIEKFEGLTEEWLEALCVAEMDPQERAHYERVKARQSARPEPPPRPQSPPRSMLREALQGLRFNAEPFERVFVAPNIPLKKLNGALDSYGGGLHPKEVVALIDNTVFGGAADGVLITEMEIRYRAAFEAPDARLWKDVPEIAAEGKYVYIEGRRFAELNMPDERDVRQLFRAVNRYLQDRN
ncbi:MULTISPECIES: DnaJ domain-containing protein [Stenotrophomonas]|jgi:hypothetical protein|uniref:J domain-containing protein n=1 Tax=Stenotrophomonas TaxID=40323 RepID=UPI001CF41EB6|nr:MULTISPECIES: DnaJ domain-containing protein [Stenotrophomonas]MCA7024937.1 J domain-containing protein [Stenotrophomonas acidaminiphila]MCE4074630.1 J domain-containing protein [Stenotrophomonas acidaminiphila]